MKAPLPTDEAQRLESLRSYDILDTPSEQAYEDLVLLAAHICQVPTAIVTLIDHERQWFKTKAGLNMTETPRDHAFCAHAILQADEVLEVPDAREDPRFADNPLVVGAPNIRFYAGAPLVTPDGHALGTLCVIDHMPRKLTPEQLTALSALSRRVLDQLALRRQARELKTKEQEANHMLALSDKSRKALLSMLEDEKMAAQNLRESDVRFRQVVENIHEVFWVKDMLNRELLYISPAYERIWGCPFDMAAQNRASWVETIHPDDKERVREAVRIKQPRGDYNETYRITRVDGSIRWIRDRAYPIRDSDGKIYRMVGTAEDITEQRELEEQLRQAQKMESIGTLAGGIAHDFNNILAGIIGYAELARMQSNDNPGALKYIDASLKASSRAVALVRQILSFSRQNDQQQEPALIQLRHVVSEPLNLLRATIPSNVEFHVVLNSGLPAVLADATQIHQVVMNLCTNASQAMKKYGGRLDVKLEPVEVDALLANTHTDLRVGPYVRLSIADNGSGMTPDTLKRIFDPFFTTKPTGEGTGLGLSVVRGIMKEHEGAITVYSQPNKGTIFNLYFPAHAEDADRENIAKQTTPHGQGQRILFVDDEPTLVQICGAALKNLGYEATTCTSGYEALGIVKPDPLKFDLVITDLTMPDMTGLDLSRKLLQLRPDLPIILTTGYSATLTAERTRELGIRELLPKPHTFHSLGTTIDRVLGTPIESR